MTKSAQIRQLASDGLSVSHIAAQLAISYQHAYNVLKASGGPRSTRSRTVAQALPTKPSLEVAVLLEAGFRLASTWGLNADGHLVLNTDIPKHIGVYAFAKDGVVLYVGVATGGLKGRLYGYSRPGRGQQTNLRLNNTIKLELSTHPAIDVLIATPDDLEWNGLPVHASAGLELGLIKKYALPWNMRSAG